jgi:uncharacterized repeat protein (TIGR01451 family)
MSVAAEARPSRQDLVVPPRQSSVASAIGAAACAAAGFGLVWGFGIGRTPRPEDLGDPVVAASAADPSPTADDHALPDAREPERFAPADGAVPLATRATRDRWEPRGSGRDAASADAIGDAAPAAPPASPDTPEVLTTSGETDEPPRFSRFSAPATPATPPDATPADLPAAAEPRATELPPSNPAIAAAAVAGSSEGQAPAAKAASLPEDPGDLAAPPVEAAAAAPPPAAPGQPPAVPPTAPPAAVSATPAPPPPGVPPAIAPPAAAAFGAAPPEIPAAAPMPPPAAAPPPTFTPAHATGLVAAASPPPAPAPVATASPFAAAPPLVPTDIAAADPEPSAAPSHAPPGRGEPVAGHGRPGPMQLEGVQTPQVSVEKRGPREISVGKPARYEILVKNVGSAVAHDVLLRDAVPQGTTLVATTPPASPVTQASGEADGSLVWALGTLAPGAQALVTMEVMPQVEGEIGSVASVSFRADASVRSRATKPDLKIECATPAPVLIGRDLQITITVTNPGTGVATGVVLEGFLPDNVSHRAGRELEFDVGQLRPGESKTIDLVLGTRGPGVHSARLAARADGGVEVLHQVPIEVTAPTLELAIDMPLRRFLQRPATCTIAMVNAGTAPARAVELAAQLPPGVKFVKANNAGWHDDRTHRVLWNLEELPAGETGTVQMVVMPVELGPQKIVAAARSADGLADQVAHTCDVEGLAALSFEVVDSEDPIEVGGVTEFIVHVGNHGTKPATGVRLVATLLGDLEPLEAEGPAAHRVENLTVTFDPLAKLAPAEEAVFRIRARGRRAGDQRVQVQLTSADQPAPITKEEVTRVYADR